MNRKEQVYKVYREIYHPEMDVYWDERLERFAIAIDNIYSDEKSGYHDVEEFYKEDDEFGPVDLTNVEPDKLPYSNEWIKFRDKKPKKNQWVFLYYGYKIPIVACYKGKDVFIAADSDDWFIPELEENGFKCEWMPLPSPPKQQKP